MFQDPLSIISCDLPLGWVVTSASGMFRLALEHIQRPHERIELSVYAAICSRVEDDEGWVTAARTTWEFPSTSERVELEGVTGVQASWQEGSTWRTRIARRGAGLDVVLDHWADARDERTQRELSRLVAGVVLPAAAEAEGGEDIQEIVATVDAAARQEAAAFHQALLRAIEVLTARWQSSLARDVRSANVEALTELVKLQFSYAIAGADTRRLLRVQGLLLRIRPRKRANRPYQPLHFDIENQTYGHLASALNVVPQIFSRIRQADNEPDDPRLAEMPDADLRMTLADYLLRYLRKAIVADTDHTYEPHNMLACAQEIVDATLFACVEMREHDEVPVELLLTLGEPLIFLIDQATEVDRMQDAAEAGALLSEQASRILQLAAGNKDATAAANRFLLIGTIAQAKALVAAGDESSFRDALERLDAALAITRLPGLSFQPDVLNIRHLEALAAVQLGDLDRASAAAAIGGKAAAIASDQYQVGYFSWVQQLVQALEGEERKARTIPELQLALSQKKHDAPDRLIDNVCSALAEAIEENPLSLNTLERLALAGRVVEPARENLNAAATALLDVRRLLLDRSPDLRIGGDDSLLARQLAAGTVEEQLGSGIAAGALAVDHACGRSLLLDLARQPMAVSRIRDAMQHRDAEAIAMERTLRTAALPQMRVAPPWAFLRAPSWLRKRADHLRQWSNDLVGVVGGAPLTESEMLECVERHGEPILLLYPVAGKIGGFLLRPSQSPAFLSTTASTSDVLQAVERLRSGLGVWQSGRGQNRQGRPSSAATEDPQAAATQLAALLVAPFEAAFSGERLTIVPYRELASVPFAVLPDDRQRPLCESCALTTASSISMLRVLQLRDAAPRSRRAFVLGDPDTKDLGTPRLPEAFEEARHLAARLQAATPEWDVQYVHDVGATPAAYRRLAANADLVHLACHGSVGNVARDSALLLAPNDATTGLLKAQDIEAVPLRSAIVFLSACRSGAGRPTADGTIGLSRAFLTAGADAVVASLWNVPDLSTRMLVDSFYDAYLSGADVASSLQRAMKATRESADDKGRAASREAHVADWGAFFVLGRGTASRHESI